jgi:arginase
MRIAIIGAPMDLGANRRGVDMGPTAIRCADLAIQLRALNHQVEDLGNISLHEPETLNPGDPSLKYLEPIYQAAVDLSKKIVECESEVIPVILGGDHSISLGSITGVVQRYGPIGVLWVDAHGDFNTKQTTPSGNIHGMVLAALAGIGDPQLTSIGGFSPKILPQRIAILGARSLDPGEKILLQKQGVHVYTMSDIDRRGLSIVTEEAIAKIIYGGVPLHVSFDIDVVDPIFAPGVGTGIPGGFTFRDAHLVMEIIAETEAMRSLDMVEVNPILDTRNQTGELAVDLICSAFGKRIM